MQKSLAETSAHPAASTVLPILVLLSIGHMLNDMMQSLLPAIYPIIKQQHGLDFTQIGLLTFAFQISASLFQPLIGHLTDKRPQPFAMVVGMAFTFFGLLMLAYAANYGWLLAGAMLVGTGSSIFHPEATRIARYASGGRQGFAQSLFQLGGQGGAALGPLLAAWIVVPRGQSSVALFAVAAVAAMIIFFHIGRWYAAYLLTRVTRSSSHATISGANTASPLLIGVAVGLLIVLMFSKNAYTASLNTYYTFYLIERFKVSIETSQVMLFFYLAANAVGVLIGGPLGDRIGRRRIILASILGALPFTLMLPYANLFWTGVLTVVIGLVMASAFAAILVYGMELLPGRVGLIGGLFYGLTFGLGAISAALLGLLADRIGIVNVFGLCALLPAIGLLTWFLPEIRDDHPV